jgi:hypothetical protein
MSRLPFLSRVILSRALLWIGRRSTAGAAWVLPELFGETHGLTDTGRRSRHDLACS